MKTPAERGSRWVATSQFWLLPGDRIFCLDVTGTGLSMMRMRREEEDDDYVILKRFVVLSLQQILSKSQESESSEHTNIFVSSRN